MPASVSRSSSSLALALALLFGAAGAARAQNSAYEALQTFSGLLSQVRLNYVDSVTTQHLVRGAIDGMLASLDPHSYFLARDDAVRLGAWRDGRLAMTGVLVDDVEGVITVEAVYPRSSAARSGVAIGDRVLAINDSATAGINAQAVQAKLIGERGSRVRLLLERGSRLEPETVTVRLRNEDVRPQTVTAARTLAGGVGYVQLQEFLAQSGHDLRDAIEHVCRTRPRRLILDLRGNPGGFIQAAVDVASLFLPEGQVVFRTQGRRRDISHEFKTEHNGPLRDVELIVLIDEGSASAAEALAGSLQDHDRALIAGRRSFGKALMQMPFEVPPNGDAVWLTVGRILTPSGRIIQRRYGNLNTAQYYLQAGRAGAAEDTVEAFHTDAGRLVRGGGGIRPDTTLPRETRLPRWWTVAADSGFLAAVTDSVAPTLGGGDAARQQWNSSPAEWQARLLPPVLDRVHRLGVRSEPDSALRALMARRLAARVAEERWGPDADDDLRLRYDPDVAAVLPLFVRLGAFLAPRH